jgi:hypothetical protein
LVRHRQKGRVAAFSGPSALSRSRRHGFIVPTRIESKHCHDERLASVCGGTSGRFDFTGLDHQAASSLVEDSLHVVRPENVVQAQTHFRSITPDSTDTRMRSISTSTSLGATERDTAGRDEARSCSWLLRLTAEDEERRSLVHLLAFAHLQARRCRCQTQATASTPLAVLKEARRRATSRASVQPCTCQHLIRHMRARRSIRRVKKLSRCIRSPRDEGRACHWV